MYQISRVPFDSSRPERGWVTVEAEHLVMKVIAWYPAGPLLNDEETTGERERRDGERKHDLVKFVAREGGVRVVRAADLTLLN